MTENVNFSGDSRAIGREAVAYPRHDATAATPIMLMAGSNMIYRGAL